MTDKPGNEPKKDPEKDPKSTSKGDPPASKVKDGEKPKEKDSTDWKAKHDEQGFAVRAAQKINEDQLAKIKILEEKTADPKDTNTRIAGLEVKLARSEAVSQHGLTVEQASRLKGTPAEILDDVVIVFLFDSGMPTRNHVRLQLECTFRKTPENRLPVSQHMSDCFTALQHD